MKIHANARTTYKTRAELAHCVLRLGWPKTRAARVFGVCPATAAKWARRFDEHGEAGLVDRSSAPHRIPHRTRASVVRRIERLRRIGLRAWQIAERLRMAVSTVSAVLRRLGLGRGWDRRREPVVRYEWEQPGDLLHVDVKKLGRFRRPGHRARGRGHGDSAGVGWEFVYVCIDDASRLAYVEVLANERKETAVGFLDRAVDWYARQGVSTRRVMTDNGSPFVSRAFAERCQDRQIRHLRTRPYRPRTNGKAERFIQTLQREWAYGKLYRTSAGRRRALPAWLRYYNQRRPHRALDGRPPIARLREAWDNLPGANT
jgi:transposase InsO family protein